MNRASRAIVVAAAIAAAVVAAAASPAMAASKRHPTAAHTKAHLSRQPAKIAAAARPQPVKSTDWSVSPWTDWSSGLGWVELDNSIKNTGRRELHDTSQLGRGPVSDPFSFGKSSLGFRTEKAVGTPPPFLRSDCTGDECLDYLPLPKYKPPDASLINARKPYFGLSINTPLQ
jgi:hypothetical protein